MFHVRQNPNTDSLENPKKQQKRKGLPPNP
jgi:hypothetical protein